MKLGVGNNVLRIGSLAVGCFATGMAYTLDAFTVYSEDLKEIFGARQSQGQGSRSLFIEEYPLSFESF